MRRTFTALATVCLAAAAGAVELAPGDVVVADPDERGVFLFDLGTGAATPISVDGSFLYPSGIAVGGSGELFVADPDARAVFEVDPDDGTQTLVCEGPPLRFPTGVAVATGGDLLVADPVANAIFVLDTDTCEAALLLSGSPLLFPSGVREEPGGDVLVVDADAAAVFRFSADPPEKVTEADLLRSPRGVGLDGADALVVDPVYDGIVRVVGGVQTFEVATDDLTFPTDLDVTPLPEAPATAGGIAGVLALCVLARRRRPGAPTEASIATAPAR